jgi:MFS transporter, ACS family, tartrate transporter
LEASTESRVSMGSIPGVAPTQIEVATLRKLRMRLLPFLLARYVIAFVDRTNLVFAAVTMNPELAISSEQFGLAAGIFFWGYFLLEIPSNLILHRIGAKVWIARILITWGAVAALTGFVQSAHQLYIARFALGLAEAGYFPGIALYLGYWFPSRAKAQALALIIIGIPIASVLGAPISGLILEGLPAILCVFLTNRLLPSRPAEAKFLTEREKAWIADQLEHEERQKPGWQSISVTRTLIHPRIWHLACIGFALGFGAYTFLFWLPQMMKSVLAGASSSVIGLLLVVPNLVGLIAMIIVVRHCDRTLERRYHMAAAGALAGIGLLLLEASPSPFLSVCLFSVVAIGSYSFLPVCFSVPGEFLSGFPAAAGIALVTSVANLGGFVGPYVVGSIQGKTGSLSAGLAVAGVSFLLSALLALLLPRKAEVSSNAGRDPSATSDAGWVV